MAFDASVIADIGGNTPDFAGSQAKALTLADLYDQNQLNKAKIAETKQAQSDMTYAKQILSGKDLSKLEDQNAAVAKITQRSPKLGMELMKGFQSQQAGKQEIDLNTLKLADAKNDIIGSAVVGLKAKHDELMAKGMNEKQIHDAMQQDVFSTLQSLTQATLPDGKPLLTNEDRQKALEGLKNGYSPQFIDAMVARSKQAGAYIKQELASRSENVRERSELNQEKRTEETIRKDKADEDLKRRKAQIVATQKSKGFTDAEGDLMAALAVRGVSLPAGLRSKEQQIALLSGLLRRNPNDSPDELAERIKTGQLDFGVQKKETTVAAGQAGKIAVAQNEVLEFGQLALEASAQVPRGDFVPWTKLNQMGERNISDPKLKRFYIMNNALLNAYDSLAARGGTDKEKRAENRHNAEIADSQETYAASIQAMKDEAAGAERAAIAATRPIGAAASAPGATNVPGGLTPAAPATSGADGWGKATIIAPQ